MKRVLTVGGAMVLACSAMWVGTASAQDDPATSTTTAPVEATTTTVVPETTTTSAPVETTTTTVVPDTTTTTVAPALALPADLPGEHVTAGSLDIDVRFAESPLSNCTTSVPLAGGQVNVARSGGVIGGVYGVAPSGTGQAGVYMVGLGAVPAGVGIVSVSNGSCEFDAIGIGAFSSTSGRARLAGVGAGVHPGAYENGEYVSSFLVEANIESSEGAAVLDGTSVAALLLRDRPGLDIGG